MRRRGVDWGVVINESLRTTGEVNSAPFSRWREGRWRLSRRDSPSCGSYIYRDNGGVLYRMSMRGWNF